MRLYSPGQGAQAVGMVSDLAAKHKEVRQTFREASDVLSQDLWKLVNAGPEKVLNLTVNAQPILLAASVATWRIWQNLSDWVPSMLAGHSLGEYSALVCARAITFHDALVLVRARAQAMQDAVPAGQGAMAAIIGLDSAEIANLCQEADAYVRVANFNSARQTVVAGENAGVRQLIAMATQAGAHKCVLLAVSVPSHCVLMLEASREFSGYVDAAPMVMPEIPVVSNVDATIKDSVSALKEALIKQVYLPVQWLQSVQYIGSEGIECFIEAGPGQVLSALLRRIDKNFKVFNLKDTASVSKVLAAFDG